MAVVARRLQVFGDVREVRETRSVLACAEDVSDLVLADDSLKTTKSQDALNQSGGGSFSSIRCCNHTLLLLSMNFTPLYDIDKIMLGVFAMFFVDSCKYRLEILQYKLW